MSDEAPPKKDEGGKGAPAWVMTFADLMSLLMCFFVLLLSFSEMDLQKFKQIAGSMKDAFGVQREIKSNESPKGTSIIAQEFTPGRPTPTLVNEIRQNTIDETKQSLEFTDSTTEEEKKESIDPSEDYEGSGSDAMQHQTKQENAIEKIDQTEVAKLSDQDAEKMNIADEMNKSDAEKMDVADEMNKSDAERLAELEKAVEEKEKINAAIQKQKQELEEKTITDAYKLLKLLEPEIRQGLVDIQTQGNRILLRINEKGSFPSGSAIAEGDFIPVLNKLRKSLSEIEGKIIVAGHTDNIPIKTARFRSNWELSAARAVTVTHELLAMDTLPPERFIVEGHGDAHPMVANDTPENRALNRRVEITIVQNNKSEDAINFISADNPFNSHFDYNNTPALTTNVQKILEEEISPPEKTEDDAINLKTLKSRFEQIRQRLLNR